MTIRWQKQANDQIVILCHLQHNTQVLTGLKIQGMQGVVCCVLGGCHQQRDVKLAAQAKQLGNQAGHKCSQSCLMTPHFIAMPVLHTRKESGWQIQQGSAYSCSHCYWSNLLAHRYRCRSAHACFATAGPFLSPTRSMLADDKGHASNRSMAHLLACGW